MKKFVDLYAHKANDEIQCHEVNLKVDISIHSKLKNFGSSKAAKYLLIKYFNNTNVSRAISQYNADMIEYDETGRSINLSCYFDKKAYARLEKIANKNKVSVNFASKVLIYYLMWQTGGNSNNIAKCAIANKIKNLEVKSDEH